MRFVSSANIACGWHAGGASVMQKTVFVASKEGVGIGVHPSYPDLMGFGRRHMECTPEDIRNYVIYQIGALKGFCYAQKCELRHVKPHGALYLRTARDAEVARAVGEAIAMVDPSLAYVTLAGTPERIVSEIKLELGLRVVLEAFPDRAYCSDGRLVPRSAPGAVISDPLLVAKRALSLAAEKKIVSIDGKEISLEPDTLCIHSDTPMAARIAEQVRKTLESESVNIRPM